MNHIEGAILSSFRAGIVAIRADGTVSYVNPIGAKILEGCSLKEGENIHPRAAENVFFRVLSEALSMNYLPTRVEAELPGRDGERQSLGFTLSVLKEKDGRVGICAFFKDLTHVEMTEESENLKQRLLMLGQMAAGLAHEIRNPIASIGVHASILRSRLSGNEKLLSSVNMMSREIEKVDYIIRECLNFVRPAELDLRQVRVDKLLDGVIARMIALHPGMVFSKHNAGNGDLVVDADAALLEQVLTNILDNAADACHGKGTVTVIVGTSRHFTDAVRLNRQVGLILPGHSGKEEEFVRIHVRDNGPGILPEIQDRVFVPFFTTKKDGTGIGLSLSQKIVHAHGGVIDMNSEAGKGTEFIIKIPMRHGSGR
ncbi:MAG: ATP-binding protein [Deltaproteobacteria bacterium]|nr:ATP-binding protein [Deltaproteobacteria bacterium]